MTKHDELFSNGRKLIVNTKERKPVTAAPKPGKIPALAESASKPEESDPHKRFVKQAIQNKPKKEDMLKEIVSLIAAAEKDL